MNTGMILFVGDDLCARINVLEHVGYTVITSVCNADSLRDAFAAKQFDAVIFNCFPEPPSRMLLDLCHTLSRAPLVIFADHQSSFHVRDFEVVVPNLCGPREWLSQLAAAIAFNRNPDRAKRPRSEPYAPGHEPNKALGNTPR